jgi:methylase of polypeptide subunit release factors
MSVVGSILVDEKARFAFGENWARFLSVLDKDRLADAEKSLQSMLGMTSLEGKTFLDIGSGSGLFSLAARRLGATVHSFDFDPQSVACTAELRRRYFVGPAIELQPAWMLAIAGKRGAPDLPGIVFEEVDSWGI